MRSSDLHQAVRLIVLRASVRQPRPYGLVSGNVKRLSSSLAARSLKNGFWNLRRHSRIAFHVFGLVRVFVLSAVISNPEYTQRVRVALKPVASQVALRKQRPMSEVKAWMEKATIAIVSSTIRETFGRTALEAHAVGACGGLREVSGENALYLDDVTPGSISPTSPYGGDWPRPDTMPLPISMSARVAAACDNIYEQAIASKARKKSG
jgi:hypothetical protein